MRCSKYNKDTKHDRYRGKQWECAQTVSYFYMTDKTLAVTVWSNHRTVRLLWSYNSRGNKPFFTKSFLYMSQISRQTRTQTMQTKPFEEGAATNKTSSCVQPNRQGSVIPHTQLYLLQCLGTVTAASPQAVVKFARHIAQ